MEQGEYQKALKILLPMALDDRIKDNPTQNSQIINNIGYCYFKTGNSKSINFLTRSLKIRTALKNDWILITSYYNLSLFYEKYNLNLSRKYAQLSYDKATSLNNVDIRLESLKLLIRNSTGEPLKKYTTNYIHINDSITKVRQQAKNQFAKIKYDSKKEKDENIKLKEQKVLHLEQEKNKNLLIYFIVTIGLLTTLFISYFLIAKNKREKIQTSYNTETRIAKKLHDELANDVYYTLAFAETQDLSTSQNKEILLSNLDTIYSRTRNISKENSTIETGLNFVSSLKEMISGFNNNDINILVNGMESIPWTKIESTKKIIVYRVLQELLVNMKKHSQCNLAVITFKKNEHKLQIDYTDNGTGTELENANLKNGLQNVENRIMAIKGTIAFETKPSKGFKSTVIFPI
jgi:signal transduction histidine kinase